MWISLIWMCSGGESSPACETGLHGSCGPKESFGSLNPPRSKEQGARGKEQGARLDLCSLA